MSIFFRKGTSFEDYVKNHPFTITIVLLNFLMLIYTFLTGGFTVTNLNELGAINGNVFESGQWWRIFTAAFLHGGVDHFLGNMIFGVMFMTAGMETLGGSLKTLAIYMFAVIVGGVLVALRTDITTIGASGGIYGILGAFLFFTFFRKDIMTKEDRQLIWIFTALQVVTTFFVPYISKEGHIGGLIGGFLICFLLFGINRDSVKFKQVKDPKIIIRTDTFDKLLNQEELRDDNQVH